MIKTETVISKKRILILCVCGPVFLVLRLPGHTELHSCCQ